MPDEERGAMSVAEAGRLGGAKRAAEIGPEGYAEMGRAGGKTTAARHGREHYVEAGRKGGLANAAKGSEYYSRIGKLGGKRIAELIEAGKKALEEKDETLAPD